MHVVLGGSIRGEEWKRSGGGAGSLGERCLPPAGVLSLRKEFVVDSLAQQWACVVIGGSLQEMELGSAFLLRSQETNAGGSVGNQMVAEKGFVPMVNFLLCAQFGGTSARCPQWKHPGGRSGKGVAEGLASFGERCLPSPGVLSPYKEIVVGSVAHRCACNPRLKLVGRDE